MKTWPNAHDAILSRYIRQPHLRNSTSLTFTDAF
jgi:hypothetical protein